MTVLVNRVDLYDSGGVDDSFHHHHNHHHHHHHHSQLLLAPYRYEPDQPKPKPGVVTVCRVPTRSATQPQNSLWLQQPVVDRSIPNPHNNPELTKYWNQRRRLFSRFDHGVQLDEEGWYSVTPEQIADHVGQRLTQLAGTMSDIVILDAFCGCGGNAIAFAKQPNLTVVGVDIDRSKLRMAAHNASIYQIPPSKLVLIECNVLFVLEHCFRDGQFVLDQPIATPEQATALMAAMPPPVPTETVKGFSIGGIDLLPRRIDAVFMDPPWGGVDYEILGKNGYDLCKNMKIQRSVLHASEESGDGLAGFFDTFQPQSKEARKAHFNANLDESNCVDGAELLRIAAAATSQHWVLYDLPRNTNRISLGQSALAAGYRGNCKLEEHYLNGRLKTVTAYFGTDWSRLMQEQEQEHQTK